MFEFLKRFTKAKDAPATALPEPLAKFEPSATAQSASAIAADIAAPQSLKERMARTVQAMAGNISALFSGNPKIDDDLLDELEATLIQADVGVNLSQRVVNRLRDGVRKREFSTPRDLILALRKDLFEILLPVELALWFPPEPKPFVILMVGVNGAGKTTTIGKLTQRLQQRGQRVMLAAGDTFRAAAVEQLKEWGARNDVTVVAQGQDADAASVVFDALQSAQAKQIDVLICDTAGRLHTQSNLMQELAKIKRVMSKLDASAPHETLLVIDGSMGQNALMQARQFHAAVGLTGIAITKLDGTAKGGIVFAVADELKLPLRLIGVGEKIEDLREFRAGEFLDTLLPESVAGN